MITNLGSLVEAFYTWLKSKGLNILKEDTDVPQTSTYTGTDGKIYPSNAWLINPLGELEFKRDYDGTHGIITVNIRVCYRFQRKKFTTYNSLPLTKLYNLYSYLTNQALRDYHCIDDSIYFLNVEKVKNAVEVVSNEAGKPDNDWLVYLNFAFKIEFAVSPLYRGDQDLSTPDLEGIQAPIATPQEYKITAVNISVSTQADQEHIQHKIINNP